jgi:hypothetical protein
MSMMIHITPPPLSSQSMADLLCTLVLFCRGQDMYNRNFWAYMCIKPSMAEGFKRAREAGDFNLGDYGTIIEAGEGTEAPAEIKRRMAQDYGVREDFEEDILRTVESMAQVQEA